MAFTIGRSAMLGSVFRRTGMKKGKAIVVRDHMGAARAAFAMTTRLNSHHAAKAPEQEAMLAAAQFVDLP